MYSYGPPLMAVQKQDDQHEHTFSSYVRIQDVVLKTYLGRWTIGRSGERGSGISMLPARHDDVIEYAAFPHRIRVSNLVSLYGISTTIGYLMPNPLYTYILKMIYKHILLITFLKWAWVHSFAHLNGSIKKQTITASYDIKRGWSSVNIKFLSDGMSF